MTVKSLSKISKTLVAHVGQNIFTKFQKYLQNLTDWER